MQGELTLRLSSSWMYIAYTSFLFDLTKREKFFFEFSYAPLLMIWQKGERNLEFYICMFMHDFLVLYKKGEKTFESFIYACLCHLNACLFFFNWYESIYVLFSIGISAYMCHLFYAYIEYFYCLLLCMS